MQTDYATLLVTEPPEGDASAQLKLGKHNCIRFQSKRIFEAMAWPCGPEEIRRLVSKAMKLVERWLSFIKISSIKRFVMKITRLACSSMPFVECPKLDGAARKIDDKSKLAK